MSTSVYLTHKRSAGQRRGDNHQQEYKALVVVPLDEHCLDALDGDIWIERAPVQRIGRLVRFGRVVNKQQAHAQGDRVQAHVQGKHGGEP